MERFAVDLLLFLGVVLRLKWVEVDAYLILHYAYVRTYVLKKGLFKNGK